MKTREARNPSHRTDGKRVVLPIPQQITRMAKSAQKFAVNHLWHNDYIGCGTTRLQASIPRTRHVGSGYQQEHWPFIGRWIVNFRLAEHWCRTTGSLREAAHPD